MTRSVVRQFLQRLCYFKKVIFFNEIAIPYTQATEANLNVNGVHAKTTAMLKVQIDDKNDQRPLFYKCESDKCTELNNFSAEVDEHASAGLSIKGLDMRVKDKDAVR